MSVFSDAELAYLTGGTAGRRLGRLATIDPDGTLNVVPLGYNYNPEHDTIDIGGRDFAATRKFRNVAANPAVGFVVDDVLPPWRPRAVQVRGRAEALDSATWPDGTSREAIIRIIPAKVISWGLDEVPS
jgi:pyridoxamine 5'-phosphate oxidase family protein